jgi:hypothetical protein
MNMTGEEHEEIEDPPCPQCGSGDTAPIHQEPMWIGSDQSDPELVEETWHRCLGCRHKWKQ